MHEAHDALMCIGTKTYLNDKNRTKLSNQHYLKSSEEMRTLFSDLPESLENNYNLSVRCSFKPETSKPILPNISSEKDGNANETLTNESLKGLKDKFLNVFKIENKNIQSNEKFIFYKDNSNSWIVKTIQF